jgi:hypothetical protein
MERVLYFGVIAGCMDKGLQILRRGYLPSSKKRNQQVYCAGSPHSKEVNFKQPRRHNYWRHYRIHAPMGYSPQFGTTTGSERYPFLEACNKHTTLQNWLMRDFSWGQLDSGQLREYGKPRCQLSVDSSYG